MRIRSTADWTFDVPFGHIARPRGWTTEDAYVGGRPRFAAGRPPFCWVVGFTPGVFFCGAGVYHPGATVPRG